MQPSVIVHGVADKAVFCTVVRVAVRQHGRHKADLKKEGETRDPFREDEKHSCHDFCRLFVSVRVYFLD